MAPRPKVNPRSHHQKAHLLDVTLIPAKYEIDWLHSKGTTVGKRSGMYVWNMLMRVITQRSKVNERSYPQRTYQLVIKFDPAKYEFDGLHHQYVSCCLGGRHNDGG